MSADVGRDGVVGWLHMHKSLSLNKVTRVALKCCNKFYSPAVSVCAGLCWHVASKMESTSSGKKAVFLFLPIPLSPSIMNLEMVVGCVFSPGCCLCSGL